MHLGFLLIPPDINLPLSVVYANEANYAIRNMMAEIFSVGTTPPLIFGIGLMHHNMIKIGNIL